MATISFVAIFLFSLFLTSQAIIPASKTFTFFVNSTIPTYPAEYNSKYFDVGITTYPFALSFYTVTGNTFILGIRMGSPRANSMVRWVWEANRDNPVSRNATLSLRSDGAIELKDGESFTSWALYPSVNTATGLKLLPNGNLVVHDRKNNIIWQTFDSASASDTLLLGQSLRLPRQGDPTMLVSRASAAGGSGPYSLVMELHQLAMYYKKNLQYYAILEEDLVGDNLKPSNGFMENVTLAIYRPTNMYNLVLSFSTTSFSPSYTLSAVKYDPTLSFMRLDMDGNLRVYTYYENSVNSNPWAVTFTRFTRGGNPDECLLPNKCGSFGVCENSQCVACPSPRGLLGWSKTCAPPVLPPCKGGATAGASYYRVNGVVHFMNRYSEGDGPLTLNQCRDQCNKDCQCAGFFFRQESSRCLLAPLIGTMLRDSNSSHVAYIKMEK